MIDTTRLANSESTLHLDCDPANCPGHAVDAHVLNMRCTQNLKPMETKAGYLHVLAKKQGNMHCYFLTEHLLPFHPYELDDC